MPSRDNLTREIKPVGAEGSAKEQIKQKPPSNEEMVQSLHQELASLDQAIKTAEKDVEILQAEDENEGDVDPEVLKDDLAQLDLAIEDLQAKEARQQALLQELALLEGAEEITITDEEIVEDGDSPQESGAFETQKSQESLQAEFKQLREQEKAKYQQIESIYKLQRELDDQIEGDVATILGNKVQMYRDGEPGFYTKEYHGWMDNRLKDIEAAGGALAEILSLMKSNDMSEERLARIKAVDTKTLAGRFGIKSPAALLQEYVVGSPTATKLYETRKQLSAAKNEMGELYKRREEIQGQLPLDWVSANIE